MNCWKCGEPTDFGQVECDKCQNTIVTESGQPVEKVAINFSKVETLQDIKEILHHLGIWVVKGTELHTRLRRFTDE